MSSSSQISRVPPSCITRDLIQLITRIHHWQWNKRHNWLTCDDSKRSCDDWERPCTIQNGDAWESWKDKTARDIPWHHCEFPMAPSAWHHGAHFGNHWLNRLFLPTMSPSSGGFPCACVYCVISCSAFLHALSLMLNVHLESHWGGGESLTNLAQNGGWWKG